jgi:signal peptide peptidase SppA
MEIQRESIFVSGLRSFCRMFFSIFGLFFGFVIASMIYGLFSSTAVLDEKTKLKYLPDAQDKKEVAPFTAPVVLQIDIHGVIGEPKSLDTDIVENILVESRTGLLKNDRVKAILLHMRTPGGTVVDSDNIYRMIKSYKERYKVPVYAYIDGLCASGGMYIACSADQVYSGNASIIGSVGVIIGPFFNLMGALDKLGIKSETITEGLHKDMMSPFKTWKEDEDASLKAITSYFYQQFVDIVTSNRPRIDRTKLINEYGAKVFDPVQAQMNGYVDQINMTRNDTLLALLQAANIDPAQPYQVVSLEPKSEWLSSFVNQKFTGKVEHTLDTGAPKIRDKIAYLYQPNG